MTKSTVHQEEWLDHLFLNQAMAGIGDAGGLQPSSLPGNFYVSMHTAAPGAGGDQTTNEVSYPSYSRAAKPRSSSGWQRSGTVVSNFASVSYNDNDSGSEIVVTHIGVGSAASPSVGQLLYYAPLASQWRIGPGETPPGFLTGELELGFPLGILPQVDGMMGATLITDSLAEDMIGHFFLNAAIANIGDAGGLGGSEGSAGNFYISLHTADPGLGGTQATNEASYTGYSRVAVARTSGGWTQNTTTAVNAAIASWGQSSGEETITHFAIGDDPSGAGKLRYIAPLSKAWNVTFGMTPRMLAAEIAIWEEWDLDPNGTQEMGHRKHARPEELVRIKHSQPTDVIVRYDLDTDQVGHHLGEGVPIVVNPWEGGNESPETSYALSGGADASNPFEETEYTTTNGISTQHLWGSERGCTVTRWKSVYGAPYNFNLEWLARTGPSGLGQGIGGSEFWYENDFRSFETQHNPTMEGTRNLPVEVNVYADEVDAPVSPPLYTNFTGAVMEGAVIPLEWDGDGSVQGVWSPTTIGNDKGAEADAVSVLYWRHKQYQRVDPHFNGSLFVHRLTYAFYNPYGLDSVDYGGRSSGPFGSPTWGLRLGTQLGGAVVLINDGPVQTQSTWDEMYWCDLAAAEPPDLVQFEDWGTGSTSGELQFTDFQTRYLGNFARATEGPKFTGDYGMVVINRSANDFCVASIFRMGVNTSFRGKLRADTHNVNTVNVQHYFTPTQYAGAPDYANAGEVSVYTACQSYSGRDPGWIGMYTYWFTGPLSQVVQTGVNLMNSGALDAVVDLATLIPASVREGTELADPPTPGGPTIIAQPTNPAILAPPPGGGTRIRAETGAPEVAGGDAPANYMSNTSRLK